MLEVNPRASRTVPFVSKATGVPVAKIAAKVMAGVSLAEQGLTREPIPSHVSVKESVFPFSKFVGVDIVLGPEMKSTGEVMGVSERFSIAFAKAQLGRRHGAANRRDRSSSAWPLTPKRNTCCRSRGSWSRWDISSSASAGTCTSFEEAGIPCLRLKKLQEGHPNVLDLIIDGKIQLVMNTPRGKGARTDEGRIRAVGRCPRRAVHHHDASRRSRGEGDGGAQDGRDDRAGAAGPVSECRSPRSAAGSERGRTVMQNAR